jgi:hypothetical protein
MHCYVYTVHKETEGTIYKRGMSVKAEKIKIALNSGFLLQSWHHNEAPFAFANFPLYEIQGTNAWS